MAGTLDLRSHLHLHLHLHLRKWDSGSGSGLDSRVELVAEPKGVIADAESVLDVVKSKALIEWLSSRRRHRLRTRLMDHPFCLGNLCGVPLDAIADLAPDRARSCIPG